jgi:Domain of unknown function (DUF4276)
MAEDAGARFTTMFDLYALPADFPGFEAARRMIDPYARVAHLEAEFYQDITDHRLIPYIQLHEFETLLFADPTKLDWEYIEHEKEISSLVEIAAQFDNPELINDGPGTAPSKRIIAKIPRYASQKASVGPLVAKQIGITKMRDVCPHFAHWLTTMERLANG